MKREIIRASLVHEANFRETFELRPQFADNPECQAAYEYAATHKLYPDEMDYIGAVTQRKIQTPPPTQQTKETK